MSEKKPSQLRNLIAEALQDIRHKVIEEPWFGRETTKDAVQDMRVQHNHEHQHDSQHTHTHDHQHHHHKGQKSESPYVKDGLPATHDEYLAKHQGMGKDEKPSLEHSQEADRTQEMERG